MSEFKEEPFVLRERTLGQILDDAVARVPDNDAIIYVDRDYRQTWREFAANVDQLAKGLMALGIQRGEKVAIWATNVPYGSTLSSAATCPPSPLATAPTYRTVAAST